MYYSTISNAPIYYTPIERHTHVRSGYNENVSSLSIIGVLFKCEKELWLTARSLIAEKRVANIK